MSPAAVRDDPNAEYSRRLQSRRLSQSSYEYRHKQLGNGKLVIGAVAVIVVAWALRSRGKSADWLLALILAFVVLETIHVRVLRSLRRCSRIIAFYERGLARLENRWMGTGEGGEKFQDPYHPYSRDLDLFGKASLFEFLCTARTSAGQEILAQWLLRPASPEEIQSRQAAVTELRSRLDLREDIAVFGEEVRSVVRPDDLTAWAEAQSISRLRLLQLIAAALSGLWLFSLVAWALWGLWELALASSVLNWVFNSRLKARVRKILPAVKFAADLGVLVGVLARLEREKFSATKLIKLQSALRESGVSPSMSIRRVSRLIESLESRRNLLVSVVDPFVLWTAQIALAIQAWRQKFGSGMRHWLNAVGEMEALIALAGYGYEHPADVFPEFADDGAVFQAKGLGHPLLPEGQAVRNDVSIGGDVCLVIISGPNMAGKSTFVRAVGTNAVLAQCGAPVRARRLRMSSLQVTASICVLDSLQGGVFPLLCGDHSSKIDRSVGEGAAARFVST